MHLKKLKLFNFKNYSEADLDFEGSIQCFVGKNGSGKTNLLDAIHYLSFTKSALNPSDLQNIKTGENHFRILGHFQKEDQVHEVTCSFTEGEKKIITDDGEVCAKFSGHIGKYPVVLIAPNDVELIWDGSELRRKFFDHLISQVSREYLEHLMVYVHHLKQRNGLLRIFAERGSIDDEMLDVYDQKLVPSGNFIYQKRREVLNEFHPMVDLHYRFLVGDSREQIQITYRSELETVDFAEVLKKNRARDLVLQRTSCGIHRDDYLFSLNNGEIKRMGSQGQQKSFLIALKLAEFQIIAQSKKMKPLLLLDDIFDKLDDERIHKLMMLVDDGAFGQLFITDARVKRSRDNLGAAGANAQVYDVSEGFISSL